MSNRSTDQGSKLCGTRKSQNRWVVDLRVNFSSVIKKANFIQNTLRKVAQRISISPVGGHDKCSADSDFYKKQLVGKTGTE